MKTWVRTKNKLIAAIIVCEDMPLGDEAWQEFPYPCDLGYAISVAGKALSDFDSNGNFIVKAEQ